MIVIYDALNKLLGCLNGAYNELHLISSFLLRDKRSMLSAVKVCGFLSLCLCLFLCPASLL